MHWPSPKGKIPPILDNRPHERHMPKADTSSKKGRDPAMQLLRFFILPAAVAFACGAAQAADAEQGAKNFRQCETCHDLGAGKAKVGPSLRRIMGRTAGTGEGFAYSEDLVAAGRKGLKWDEASLMAYLADPSAFLKAYLGKEQVTNKMQNKYAKEDFRADVIAYLKQAAK